MGLHAIPTTTAHWDGAALEADRLICAEGQGLQSAFAALDSGRLAARPARPPGPRLLERTYSRGL
jgi:alkylation response protein AidB-like acyl-CoA dehydrogenase